MDTESPEATPIEKERDECLNGWKRAQADLANYRADEHKRFEEFAKFAHQNIMRDLIAVLDSFSLALKAIPENDAAGKGAALIKAQLEEVMKKYGLERIVVEKGSPFDPRSHEAIAAKPPENGEVPDAIVEEIEAGYALRGKVIRPARVIVVK